MLKPGGKLDLAKKPLGSKHGGDIGMKDFERDWAVVLEVVSEVYRRHTGAAELPVDPVMVAEHAAERRVIHGHGVFLANRPENLRRSGQPRYSGCGAVDFGGRVGH